MFRSYSLVTENVLKLIYHIFKRQIFQKFEIFREIKELQLQELKAKLSTIDQTAPKIRKIHYFPFFLCFFFFFTKTEIL